MIQLSNSLGNSCMNETQKNVLGSDLQLCGKDPVTGFYRNGCCNTGPGDIGTHTICAVMTDEFLEYSKGKGNDLITPRHAFGFPGLKAGDLWCICALRWDEARRAGRAPGVKLMSTNIKTLELVELDDLTSYGVDLN